MNFGIKQIIISIKSSKKKAKIPNVLITSFEVIQRNQIYDCGVFWKQ